MNIRGLRARFLALLICLLMIVFGAVTYVIVHENTSTLRDNLVSQSKSFAALATKPIGDIFLLYHESGTIRIQQQIDHFTSLDPNINKVDVVDTSGKSLFSSNNQQPQKISTKAAISLDPTYIYDSKGHITTIVQPYIENFGIHRYGIAYGVSYASVDQTIRTTISFIMVISISLLLVLLIVSYVLIDRIFLQPVAYVSRMALIISRGDLSKQIQLARKDEIGDLAAAVDTMANSLKADIAKLKEVDELKNEFLIIASHNLRTPLTVIKSYIEELDNLHEGDDWRKIIDPIKTSVIRLDGFAEDLLTISTFEAGENILHPEPIEMKPVLAAVAEEFSVMAKEKGLHFTTSLEANGWASLSRSHFRNALWNLLDNAHKFTDKDGSVSLKSSISDGHFNITVTDTGTGIPPSEIPHLFTKFHRATDLLTYNYEGTGIGLYIAKLIVEKHGGTIGVESIEGRGSAFTISLPLISPPKPPQSS